MLTEFSDAKREVGANDYRGEDYRGEDEFAHAHAHAVRKTALSLMKELTRSGGRMGCGFEGGDVGTVASHGSRFVGGLARDPASSDWRLPS